MTAGTLTRPPARRTATRRPSGRPGPVHDRIAARRREVERDRARRRLRWLIALATVLLVVLAVLVVDRTPLVAFNRFDIDLGGAQHLSVPQVEVVAGIHPGTPMSAVDVDGAARRLAALPWVESATVRRRWPSTLAISVVERTVVAQAPSDSGGWVLLDEGGHVADRSDAALPGLVQLAQPTAALPGGGVGSAWSDELRLAGRLPASVGGRLLEVQGAGTGLQASIDTGGTVRFCGTGQLAEKIVALNTMLQRVDPAQVGVLDLCVPTAPALTPRSVVDGGTLTPSGGGA